MGYHIMKINKGEFGELSKIQEELDELKDAVYQGSSIMALIELSDIIGAIDGYLAKHHPNQTLGDLIKMAELTGRAFKSGERQETKVQIVPVSMTVPAWNPSPKSPQQLQPPKPDKCEFFMDQCEVVNPDHYIA